jgi:hypothetical protein
MKYYSYKDDEECYLLSHFIDLINQGEIEDGIILEEMKREYGSNIFWCNLYDVIFEKGEGDCGFEQCVGYDPRNGKSGCCKHFVAPLIGSKSFQLKNGKLTEC